MEARGIQPVSYTLMTSIWASIFIPSGTIAQLGERATEVRKVAGSIPARPITFCIFFTYPHYTHLERKNE
ncbi:hypothetical protein ACN42_g11746 [Penicillium freii]|uniref:Uncharacterized protein n=1 Tax=Penicillium freii TaxID=48697 RepID=A0A101M7U5_PENFR|nr:hypothetical protein ACN42_g11746 [Penicillium freii]